MIGVKDNVNIFQFTYRYGRLTVIQEMQKEDSDFIEVKKYRLQKNALSLFRMIMCVRHVMKRISQK